MRILSLIVLFAVTAIARAVAQADADPTAFLAECAALAKQAETNKTATVAGTGGWLFLAGELRHLGVGQFWGDKAAAASRATKPENADPLPAIVDFNEQLRTLGIDLVVVPVPPQAIIYPDELPARARPAGDRRLDPHHQAFYKLLRAKGVQVVDLVPGFREQAKGTGASMFCQQDSHWSGAACVYAAGILGADIKQKPWFAGVPKKAFKTESREIVIKGDLFDGLPAEVKSRLAPEKLTVRFVGTGEQQQPVPPDPASPILLLGDSHTLFLHAGGDMQAAGAGLADQLAFELGFALDVIGVRGSGATPARVNLLRKVRANPGYLQAKKLIIWCFAAREFTESDGWGKVPVVPK